MAWLKVGSRVQELLISRDLYKHSVLCLWGDPAHTTLKEHTMSDRFCTIVFTTMLLGSVYIGWDTDGNFIRQALLMLAGYATGGLFLIFISKE